MITKNTLDARSGLYLRANGVLSFSLAKIDNKQVGYYQKDGKTMAEQSWAKDRGFDPKDEATLINNIHTYFKYFDILARYEDQQMTKEEDEREKISFIDYSEKVVNPETGVITYPNNKVSEKFQPIFTMLPNDEPRFQIDLNTRRINIPSQFIGQQVQGDHYAETIWFETDRYFDATDLNQTDIHILWDNGKDDPKEIQAFNPTADLVVTQSYGKIVFGWPLTQTITQRAGNIKFSIRFTKGGGQDFSLSTLPANLRINDKLNIELDPGERPIETSGGFYNNLKKQSFYSVIPAATPELLELYANGETALNASKVIDLVNNQVELKCLGDATSTTTGKAGFITYDWIRFYEDANENIIQEKVVGNDLVQDSSNGKEYSRYIATAPGYYGPAITNSYAGDSASYVASYHNAETKKNLIHIPYPQKPVFKNKADKDLKVVYNKDAIIEFELNNAENPTYAWEYSADNSANSWSIIEGATLHSYAVGELDAQEGWYRLVASNHKNNETKTTTSEKSFIVTKPVQPVSVTAFKTSAKTYEIESTIVIDESGKIKIKPQLGANLNGSGKSALQNLSNVSIRWELNGQVVEGVNPSTGELEVNVPANSSYLTYNCIVRTEYNYSETNKNFAEESYTIMIL